MGFLADGSVDGGGLAIVGLQALVGFVTIYVINEKINEFRQEKKALEEAGNTAVSKTEVTIDSVTTEQWQKLSLCILLDLGGSSSFLIPVLGEFTDAAYAPFEALLLLQFFKSGFVSSIGFIEEALLFTDGIPTFTIAWIVETFYPYSPLAKMLGLQKDPVSSTVSKEPVSSALQSPMDKDVTDDVTDTVELEFLMLEAAEKKDFERMRMRMRERMRCCYPPNSVQIP